MVKVDRRLLTNYTNYSLRDGCTSILSLLGDECEAGGVFFPDFYIPHVATALESGGRGVDGGSF